MKKNLLCTVILLLSCSFAFSQTYHQSDKEGLRKFLRQPSAEAGKINAEQVGLQLSDTLNWDTEEAWVDKVEQIFWDESSPKRLIQVGHYYTSKWSEDKLAGNFDASYWENLAILLISTNQISSLDVTKNLFLDYLDCGYNNITSLDLTQNTGLTTLYCRNSGLTSLDLSKNVELKYLDINYTSIPEIDLSKNTNLTKFTCQQGSLTSLDVTQNTELIDLDCFSNQITSLDLSKNTKLKELKCADNPIASLDVSNNTALEYLSCSGSFRKGLLTSLDVSNNLLLKKLYCYYNDLTSLDVTQNTALEILNCSNNMISALDLSKNTNLKELDCSKNTLLFSAIPEQTEIMTKYVYAPQKPIEGEEVMYSAGIDLSREFTIGENTTTFSWFDITDGNEISITSLTTTDGVFELDGSYADKKLRCKMTNESLPLLKDANALVYEIEIADIIHISNIELNQDTLRIKKGETATLIATITPQEATIKNVVWGSNHENIATINEEGVVAAIAKGVATITATTTDGGKTANCVVIVEEASAIKEHCSSPFVLHPNPVDDVLSIRSPFPVELITIYDINGKKIKQKQNIVQSIEVSELPSGIYTVVIKANQKEFTHKMIKR